MNNNQIMVGTVVNEEQNCCGSVCRALIVIGVFSTIGLTLGLVLGLQDSSPPPDNLHKNGTNNALSSSDTVSYLDTENNTNVDMNISGQNLTYVNESGTG